MWWRSRSSLYNNGFLCTVCWWEGIHVQDGTVQQGPGARWQVLHSGKSIRVSLRLIIPNYVSITCGRWCQLPVVDVSFVITGWPWVSLHGLVFYGDTDKERSGDKGEQPCQVLAHWGWLWARSSARDESGRRLPGLPYTNTKGTCWNPWSLKSRYWVRYNIFICN